MDIQDAPAKPTAGLILSGGGARAAYQVGVLRAIAETLPRRASNPFPVICGTSAGAINAAVLAVYATRFQEGVERLVRVWRDFHVDQVFRSDAAGVFANGARWLAALMLGGLGRHNPMALLDCAPLRRLLEQYAPCETIQDALDAGALRALSVTAAGYTTGQSVTFYQGVSGIAPWKRARRIGLPVRISVDHLLASSAIPLIFTAVKINREYFGDGSLGQIAPISPALHLGADRVLVIGSAPEPGVSLEREQTPGYPSLAQIAGQVLNGIFLDTLEADLERLRRINKTLELIPPEVRDRHGLALRPIEVLVFLPSADLAQIAQRHTHLLPRPVRFLLRGVGALNRHGANLVSYLLFEAAYCRELIELGYTDALRRRDEILRFLGVEREKGKEES